MRRSLVETVVPARLGTSFRWLLGSSWISNIGDGIILAAGPLLVASETREPLLVALAWTLQYLPTMLFALFAGVVAGNTGLPEGHGMSDAVAGWIQYSQSVPELPVGGILQMGTGRTLTAAEVDAMLDLGAR